jgi:antitoxin component YwqK of YwqJK toxin-antitoxin module
MRGIIKAALLIHFTLFFMISCSESENEVRTQEIHYPDGVLKEEWQEIKIDDTTWVRHGQYNAYYQDGTKKREHNFVRGEQDGPQLGWHYDGSKWYEKYYIEGKPEGEQTQWHRNGQVKSIDIYKDGKLHGTCLAWHKDGTPHEKIDFNMGRKDGVRLRFSFEGDTIVHEIFENNKMVERIK